MLSVLKNLARLASEPSSSSQSVVTNNTNTQNNTMASISALPSPFSDYIIIFSDIYGCKRLNLPLALIAYILSYGNFIPIIVASNNRQFDGRENDDSVYLRVPIFKIPLFKPTSLFVSVTSKDQGWSSYPEHHGTRVGSWSWFEFSLSTSTSPYIYSARQKLFTNIHAGRAYETQSQEFGVGSTIFQSVRDAYTALIPNQYFHMLIWSRSAYPGWRNNISQATIEMMWECEDYELIVQYANRIKMQHRPYLRPEPIDL